MLSFAESGITDYWNFERFYRGDPVHDKSDEEDGYDEADKADKEDVKDEEGKEAEHQ